VVARDSIHSMQRKDAELGAELLKIYKLGPEAAETHKGLIAYLEKEREGLAGKARRMMPDP
jgi:hypothetical protein